MIRYFKQVLAALQALVTAVEGARETMGQVARAPAQDVELRDRVDALERSRAIWEAELEAHLARAETKLKASRSAEERARGMERRAQELVGDDEDDPEGLEDLPQQWLDLVSERDADGGEEEAVQPLRPSVGRQLTGRELAKAAKWGR